MDNEMKSRIEGLELLGVSSDTSSDLVALIRAVAEMTVTEDMFRLDFLIDYSDHLLRCIQTHCLSRLYCEKE